jgi:4'-phosphopantetheinyl transferase EntD
MRAAPSVLHQAKLVFSAKESVYKCVAPLMGVFLEFADVEILFGAEDDSFCARGHGPAETLINSATVNGRFVAAGGYWLTLAWQRPEPRQAPGSAQG